MLLGCCPLLACLWKVVLSGLGCLVSVRWEVSACCLVGCWGLAVSLVVMGAAVRSLQCKVLPEAVGTVSERVTAVTCKRELRHRGRFRPVLLRLRMYESQ